MDTNSVEIFYIIDEFCKEIEKTMEGHNLPKDTSKKTRKRAFIIRMIVRLSVSVLSPILKSNPPSRAFGKDAMNYWKRRLKLFGRSKKIKLYRG